MSSAEISLGDSIHRRYRGEEQVWGGMLERMDKGGEGGREGPSRGGQEGCGESRSNGEKKFVRKQNHMFMLLHYVSQLS